MKITIEKVGRRFFVGDHQGEPKIKCDSVKEAINYIKQFFEMKTIRNNQKKDN